MLSTFGGVTPQAIEASIHGVMELLQFYGLSQVQVLTTAATPLAVGNTVTLPLGDDWCVLFSASASFAKTATMTALRGRVNIGRGQNAITSALFPDEELGPYGATTAGQGRVGGFLPYPLLCPPGSSILAGPNVLGTDANVTVIATAEIGVLG